LGLDTEPGNAQCKPTVFFGKIACFNSHVYKNGKKDKNL
jgi:hypothetical protein